MEGATNIGEAVEPDEAGAEHPSDQRHKIDTEWAVNRSTEIWSRLLIGQDRVAGLERHARRPGLHVNCRSTVLSR